MTTSDLGYAYGFVITDISTFTACYDDFTYDFSIYEALVTDTAYSADND
jgi:hypothetical protein